MGADTDELAEQLARVRLAGDTIEGERQRRAVKAGLLGEPASETRIDRFVVLGQLGAGGMGIVYAAYDPELDRKVAIKLVRTWGMPKRAEDQQRLVREARALARLAHPNIVAVYEVGLYRDEVFVAMEFVRGKTLHQHLEIGRTPWRDVVRTYLQAGEGLAAAHAAGLVHRDFKPDNAIVGDDGRVRVVDFGISRGESSEAPQLAAVDDPERATTLTPTGALVGTPAYMAPEQRLGLPGVPRSDQFSFCAALHEALVGTPPGDDGGAALVGRKLPARLRRAIEKGLAPNIAARFVDMPALLAELRATQNGARRVRTTVVLAAIVGAGAGAVISGRLGVVAPCPDPSAELADVWSDAARAPVRAAAERLGEPMRESAAIAVRELDGYAERWIAARHDACEAHWVRRTDSDWLFDRRMRCLDRDRRALHELVVLLGEGDPRSWQHAVDAVLALAPVDACADVDALQAEAAWPEDPVTVAAIERVGAEIDRAHALENLGRLAEARPLAEATVEAALATGHRRTEAEALAALAWIADAEERDPEAAALIDDAVWRAEAGRADELAAELLARAMGIAVARGLVAEAVALERRIGGVLERIGRPSRVESQFIHARFQLADLQGDYAAAEAFARTGIASAIRDGGEGALDVARHTHNLAVLQYESGRLLDAELSFTTALAIRQKWQGATHPDVLITRMGVASVYDSQGRIAESQAVLESIVADGERAFAGPSPVLAQALANLAYLHQKAGRIAEARALVDRAIGIIEATVGRDDPRAMQPLLLRGILDAKLGQREEARASYERAIAIADRVDPDNDIEVFAWNNLADLELDGGDANVARELATKALALQTRVRGPEHPITGQVAYTLARADFAAGATRDAIVHARQALPILAAGGPGEAPAWARAQFLLARALLREAPGAARSEAIAAGKAAAERFEGLGDATASAEVHAWLASVD